MIRIDPPDWMRSAATQAVIKALCAGGAVVRFVGGAVRDTLLGRPVTDIDLATPEPPQMVLARLMKAGLRALPTGLTHGTITALSGHRQYEITTLRRDVETDGRHAKVVFTDDWAEDAARRDFTMNALYADPDGTLLDPTGGYADIQAGRVRFVGDPVQRIREDALRLLRFFRFQAHYGRETPDAAALQACQICAADLQNLSGERLWMEIGRLLQAPDPTSILRQMDALGILAHLPGPMVKFDRLERLVRVETDLQDISALRRLASLLPCGAGSVVARRFRLSNADTKTLRTLTQEAHRDLPLASPAIWEARCYRMGREATRDLLLLSWTFRGENIAQSEDWQRFLSHLDTWTIPVFPLRGEDIVKGGISPGPKIGKILATLEEIWISGGFIEGRDALLARLKIPDAKAGQFAID